MEKGKMCFECGAKDAYELKNTIREYKGDGYHFEILVNVPFCKNCGAPIYDEEIEREIVQKANKKIREQCKIITREEILEILESYHVSQKFLSKLLGWGEITLTRYISGNYTPNISNSNKLKTLKNPYIFQMLVQNYCEEQYEDLIERKENKSLRKAQNGILCELNRLEEKQGKIFHVVNWFLSQSSQDAPVTHLALQKLLYFVQSWSMVLLDDTMFYDDCQVSVHGAVYPNVYNTFKWFKYMPLPKVENTYQFNDNELKILNSVKKYYFDLYSAKALEEICHREEPYIKARKGYEKEESGHHLIEKEEICSYYNYISQKYKIFLDDMSNMKAYLNILLSY